jgi:hypothetical protein
MKTAAKESTNMADPVKPIDPKSVDFPRVHMLLNIVQLSAGHGPRLSQIGNTAMAELNVLNNKLKIAAQEEEKKAVKLRAEADAKERAKVEAANAPPPPSRRTVATTVTADEEADVEPNVYPGDSETATIADRRL